MSKFLTPAVGLLILTISIRNCYCWGQRYDNCPRKYCETIKECNENQVLVSVECKCCNTCMAYGGYNLYNPIFTSCTETRHCPNSLFAAIIETTTQKKRKPGKNSKEVSDSSKSSEDDSDNSKSSDEDSHSSD